MVMGYGVKSWVIDASRRYEEQRRGKKTTSRVQSPLLLIIFLSPEPDQFFVVFLRQSEISVYDMYASAFFFFLFPFPQNRKTEVAGSKNPA